MEDARGRSEMVKVLRMSQAERSVARRMLKIGLKLVAECVLVQLISKNARIFRA